MTRKSKQRSSEQKEGGGQLDGQEAPEGTRTRRVQKQQLADDGNRYLQLGDACGGDGGTLAQITPQRRVLDSPAQRGPEPKDRWSAPL